ncbi:MAG: hypothetical protein WKF75_21135 [Singulisphaera sp.]
MLKVAEKLVSKSLPEIMAILTPDLPTQLMTISAPTSRNKALVGSPRSPAERSAAKCLQNRLGVIIIKLG